MKKIIFIMLLAIIGFGSKTMGQGNSNSANIVSITDTINSITVSISGNEVWFKFVAPDTGIVVNLSFPQNVTIPLTNIALYKKQSNSLVLVQENNSTQGIYFDNNSSNDTSYIKVTFLTPYSNYMTFRISKAPPYWGIGARQSSLGGSFNQCINLSQNQTCTLITLCNTDQPVDLECIVPSDMLNYPYAHWSFRFKCDGNYISPLNPIIYSGNPSLPYPYITTTLSIGTHSIELEIYDPNTSPWTGQLCNIVGPTWGNRTFLVKILENPVPTITGYKRICSNTESVTYTTEPNMTNYTWNISGGTIVSGNGTNTVTVVWNTNGNQTISVNYSNGVCMANSPTVLNVTVGPVPAPIFTGNNNNCDAYQTPALLTNYTVTNVNPNYSYTWYANQGTINGANNNTNVNVMWNQNISNSSPATITVVVSESDRCTNTASLNVYNCCFKPGNELYYDQTLSQQPTGNFFINGTVVFDCDVTLNNSLIEMGPYSKIIVTPNHFLKIDQASTLQAYCDYMWDGIYISDPSSQIEVTGNTLIKDAINGLVSENGGIITTNNATLKDNYYSIRVKNTHNYYPIPGVPYTPYPGSIKNTRFEGNTNLPYPPYINKKSLAGIDCNNANNFTIGDDAATALKNYYSDMRFGIYANNSDLNIYNNKFTNIVNGYYLPLPMQKFYPEGAIYAVHNDSKLILYNSIVVGGNGLKRNYFENCNTGVYSFQYLNTIDNNDAKNCVNGIRSLQLVHNSTYTNNIIYSTINHGVTSGYGIDLRNTHSDTRGIKCLVFDNQVINKRNGISLIGISGTQKVNRLVEVKNNLIDYYVSQTPYVPVLSTEKQIGIWIQNCHYSIIQENSVYRNYPVLASTDDPNNVLGIRIAESRNATVFQNTITRMGSGIFTNGNLTNTLFTCNTLDNAHYGFQFGLPSSITDQGIPTSQSPNYNPYNSWYDFNAQPGHERMYAPVLALTSPFKYYYDPNAGSLYNPNPSSGTFSLNQNQGASFLCLNQGPIVVDPNIGIDAREAAFGQIVRNEKYYSCLQDEFKQKDREYVYEMLRKYPELIYMGGADDNLYLQFFNEVFQSEIEKVMKLRDEMYENNIAIAKEKLALIADDNAINTNRKIADGIYLDTWASNNFEFTEEQETALTTLAYLTPYSGGDAVYTARVLLNINPDDAGLDFAKPPAPTPAIEKEINVNVFPNPAKDKLNIMFNEIIAADAIIEIYGNLGNIVLTENIFQGNINKIIDISKLKSGLYFYSISLNGSKISSGKFTILNK